MGPFSVRRTRAVTQPETGQGYYPRRLDRRSRPRPPLHFRRLELKYFLPDRWIRHLIEQVSPFTEIDPYLVREGRGRTSYPVTSLYFDSYDLSSFFEKENGLLFRRKIRLRTYEQVFSPEYPCFIEVKRRLDSVVIKDRLALPAGALDPSVPISALLRHLLDHAERDPLTSTEACAMASWLNLVPTAVVRYQRTALVGTADRSLRITVDRSLEGSFRPASYLGPSPLRSISNINPLGTTGITGRYALLELKCNNVIPAWLHRVIRQMELMRTAYSKYYLTVAALRPRLREDCDPQFLAVSA